MADPKKPNAGQNQPKPTTPQPKPASPPPPPQPKPTSPPPPAGDRPEGDDAETRDDAGEKARVVGDTEGGVRKGEPLDPIDHPHPGVVPPPRATTAQAKSTSSQPIRDPNLAARVGRIEDPELDPLTRGTKGPEELPRGREVRDGVFDDSDPVPAGSGTVRTRQTAATNPDGSLDERNSPPERPVVGYNVPAARNFAPRAYRTEDGGVSPDAPHVAGGTVACPTATPPMNPETGETDVAALADVGPDDRIRVGTVLPSSPEVIAHPDPYRRQTWGSGSDPSPSQAQDPETSLEPAGKP